MWSGLLAPRQGPPSSNRDATRILRHRRRAELVAQGCCAPQRSTSPTRCSGPPMASVRRRLLPVPTLGRGLGSARCRPGVGCCFAVRLQPSQSALGSGVRRPFMGGRRWRHRPASQGLGGDPTARERITTYLSPASRRPIARYSSVASIGQMQDHGAAPDLDSRSRVTSAETLCIHVPG